MEAVELEKCIDAFGTDIYRFCMKLCANRSDAEDLYQQTFLKALEKDWILDWEQNPKALFFSMAHNLWKSDMRKIARRTELAPCTNLKEENENQIGSGENIEDNFIQRETAAQINEMVESLPEKIRVPLTLFYFFEFSVEQIAQIIKKPSGTVKSRLFKGRNIIKKRLEETGYGK